MFFFLRRFQNRFLLLLASVIYRKHVMSQSARARNWMGNKFPNVRTIAGGCSVGNVSEIYVVFSEVYLTSRTGMT